MKYSDMFCKLCLELSQSKCFQESRRTTDMSNFLLLCCGKSSVWINTTSLGSWV